MSRPFNASGQSRRAIRALLHKTVASLATTEVEKRDVEVTSLEEAERLYRLLELEKGLQAHRWRGRVALFATILVCITALLLLLRVPTVEIQGTVSTSWVELTVPTAQILVIDQPVHTLASTGFSGVEGLTLSSTDVRDGSLNVQATAGGTVTLQEASIPAGSMITIEMNPTNSHLKIEGGKGHGRAIISLTGPTDVFLNSDTIHIRSESDASLALSLQEERFDLTFASTDSSFDLLRRVKGSSLEFSKWETLADDDRVNLRSSSMILGGEIFFIGMDDRTMLIKARDQLRFRPQSLQVQRVRLQPEGLLVEFRARVSDLSIDTGIGPRDLRPSILAWFAANHNFAIARTLILSTVTLFVALIVFWVRGL
jgi:hypothetical protein